MDFFKNFEKSKKITNFGGFDQGNAGFGFLLLFSQCYKPHNCFVKYLPRLMDTVGCGNCAENMYNVSLHNCFGRMVEGRFDPYEGPIFEKSVK